MTNGSNHLGTYDPNQRDERTKLLAFLHLSLMVLGKIVTNVEKLLPLKLGFFSPSSSVEKLASIVSHFYKSLSSIVIPFTKECDIIFPNHLPNCYLTSSKTMDPTWLWPPWFAATETWPTARAWIWSKQVQPNWTKDKRVNFHYSLSPLCFVVALHLLLIAFKTVFNRAVFFHTSPVDCSLLPFFLSCWS